VSDALEVHGLWKSYAVGVRGCSARVSVLRGVSFRVACGERVGILGARGAGKTTLLHCIAGLRRPDAGVVRMGEPRAAAILLLDDGSPEGAGACHGSPAAMLLFARESRWLEGRVGRVLVLRDGLVRPLDSALDAVAAGRRVAEP
jgi:energy-coupling factor transporter ATP-binding protein EcfA2